MAAGGRHWLASLLAPGSVAIVGASPRPGSFGNDLVRVLREGGFAGTVHPVNSRYGEIDGLRCFPSVEALPAAPDLAVLGVAGNRIEAALEDAIAGGAKAAVIFDNCYLEADTTPTLVDRLRARARDAGIPVCGGNGMGFYNFDARTHVSFQAAPDRPPGQVALIAHSGSVFVLLAASDPRLRYNLMVSPGQEIGATTADYLDYALDQPSTRAVALFIETVRDPAAFVAALHKARERDVPVIALKVGRTEESARHAATHCGAIAGNDAAYGALFDRYGVVQVDTLDELAATALLLSQQRRAGPGELAAVTDSGGLRELLIDLAHDRGVPFARLAPETAASLRARLPHGLEAANPLDAAGALRGDYAAVFEDCLGLLMEDPATAVGAFEFEARDDFSYMPALLDTVEAMPARTTKPFLVVNSFSGARNRKIATRLLDAGVPVINGVQTMLAAVRGAFVYRDARARPLPQSPTAPGAGVVARWSQRLRREGALDEAASLDLLADFGVPVVLARVAEDAAAAMAAAVEIGFPVALKTAAPGVQHKSEVDGVRLSLAGPDALLAAYAELAGRLGPRVTVEPMVSAGVELAFGGLVDPQFGPLVMVGSGGRLVEVLRDRVFALAPFDAAEARYLLDRLRIRPLLDGVRGAPPVDLAAVARALAQFSGLVAALREVLVEVDVNPVVAGPAGAVAVDALAIGRKSDTRS